MRKELINYIYEEKRPIYFLTADLGYSILEKLITKVKSKFLNTGVCENNMFLLAVGLSTNKKNTIYVYSISSFLILRSIEIIRNYLNYENRKIRMIGVGSGASYETMGKTHFNFDDINLLYTFKNIVILNPANLDELKFVYKKFFEYEGPLYFRINKFSYKNTLNLKKKNNFFIKQGYKNNIICSGIILNYIQKIFNENEIKKLNLISIPILKSDTFVNLPKLIVKGKILILHDSNESAIFKDIEKIFINKKCLNMNLNAEKIKKVDNEFGILKQAGFSKKKIKEFLKNGN